MGQLYSRLVTLPRVNVGRPVVITVWTLQPARRLGDAVSYSAAVSIRDAATGHLLSHVVRRESGPPDPVTADVRAVGPRGLPGILLATAGRQPALEAISWAGETYWRATGVPYGGVQTLVTSGGGPTRLLYLGRADDGSLQLSLLDPSDGRIVSKTVTGVPYDGDSTAVPTTSQGTDGDLLVPGPSVAYLVRISDGELLHTIQTNVPLIAVLVDDPDGAPVDVNGDGVADHLA